MTPSEFFVGLGGLPSLRNRLPIRVIGGMLVSLIAVFMLLAWMLSLSRGLEHADIATKEINSLRVSANQIAIELIKPDPGQHMLLTRAVEVQDHTLSQLLHSNSNKRLWLPVVLHVKHQLDVVNQIWMQRVKPAVDEAEKTGNTAQYLNVLSVFLSETDRLTGMIEFNSKKKRNLLRFLQGSIAAIGSVGTGLAIYLLYVWFIQPMLRLRDGLQQLSTGNFSTRLAVNTRDEFGVLANGFNLMAEKLERLYAELDHGVRTKTAELEKKNKEIAFLYSITAFLNLSNDSEAICRGFLVFVMKAFDASGGIVRMIAAPDESAHIVLTEGTARVEKTSVFDESLASNYVADDAVDSMTFRIMERDEILGVYTIFFIDKRQLSESEIKLLNTLGQHLGVALDNRRLEAKSRRLAVTHERSLLAQGLHDSIAQGLNFLNMQLQLLEEALEKNDYSDVQKIVPLLRMGVDESYQDVRELLVNFRTKLDHIELPDAIEDVVKRFRRQTDTAVSIDMHYKEGPPLSAEQQLQVLFILQEALSNVRKHAKANHVHVLLRNQNDFEMEVIDNGVGYVESAIAKQEENHIGLQIMRERASRLHAVLTLISTDGLGTTVKLVLPHDQRSID